MLAACQDEYSGGGWSMADELLADKYDAASLMLSAILCEDITPDDVPDMKGKTFEPQYGLVLDESNSFERTVIVNDAEMAQMYFCGLGGYRDDIVQETADGFLIDFTEIGMGTLEFFYSDGGSNVGYALVDVPCIPHLQRFTYKTEAQVGSNAELRQYESPIGYGDILLHDGRYYICVREASGYDFCTCGLLVCMEAGKGTNWKDYLSDESWGCWTPIQSWTAPDYLSHFLLLCADPSFKAQKARIIAQLPGKVFPKVQIWDKRNHSFEKGDYTWGFGCPEEGYSHVTRFYDNLSDEPSNSDKKKDKWKKRYAVVARHATEGNYKWKKARWERRFHYVAVPYVSKYNKGYFFDTKKYTGKGGWEDFFEDNTLIVYTMNVARFYETIPTGYVLQDI